MSVDLVTFAMVSLGACFFLAGTVGLLRFPDPLSRLHALTKADNLGLGLVVLGLLPQVEGWLGALRMTLNIRSISSRVITSGGLITMVSRMARTMTPLRMQMSRTMGPAFSPLPPKRSLLPLRETISMPPSSPMERASPTNGCWLISAMRLARCGPVSFAVRSTSFSRSMMSRLHSATAAAVGCPEYV